MDSTNPLKILILASEVAPFVKTGGIADVVGELPCRLKALGHDVRVALPRYRVINVPNLEAATGAFDVPLDGAGDRAAVLEGKLAPDVPVYFIENARYYDRDAIYMYPDDAERFLFFSRAALEMLPRLGWQPDLIHVNDWQTAIVPNWLKTIYAGDPFYRNIASVYTIHNLAYFGTFGQRILEIAGLARFGFIAHPQVSSEINDELNFMARGIMFADAVNTVSETYAREIQTPEFGEGLDPVLRMRASRLRGILNGIDYNLADPANDPALVSPYDADRLEARAANKDSLQRRSDLPVEPATPLVAMISRLNNNKGLDLVNQIAEPLLGLGVQLVVSGAGDAKYQDALNNLQTRYPNQVRFFHTFDRQLTRQVVAGADILLMPSRVEPGGTTQLLAMHYGCIPVVRRVGGLADSVSDYDAGAATGNGFIFDRYDAWAFFAAVVRALEVFKRKDEWRGIQQRAMREDFSWRRAAEEYVDLYRFALEKKHEAVERDTALAREVERTAEMIENLPPRIRPLGDLVYNLWWSWNNEALALLEHIDAGLWRDSGHNPIKMLRGTGSDRLAALAADADFLARFDRVMATFETYMRAEATWFEAHYPYAADRTIAYFSAEFGIDESLPIYSGGLGVLSGDHVKEASDMGLPLVAIGFLYPQGYFRQEIDENGNQIARYDKLDFAQVPALVVKDQQGGDLQISVELPGRTVHAKVYHIRVGRVMLYLMDTDVAANAEHDRVLTARLYGGDHELRIMQEIMLGIGGVRVLRALGLNPSAYHMNEGHSSFLVLELARERVASGMSFDEAQKWVAAHSIFTTHTPVPAGNDAFAVELMDKYFGAFYPQLGISRDEFLKVALDNGLFSMTVLGLKFSDQRNGVSKLHGEVSRRMWSHVFGTEPEQTPIAYITNGVHTASWLAAERYALYSSCLGPDWYDRLDDPQMWNEIRGASNAELWQIQLARKRVLVDFTRDVLIRQLTRQNGASDEIERARQVLTPDALTIGFARRFATYKRATLFVQDVERIKRLVSSESRPVQFIFAGKAHPADLPGQDLIRALSRITRDPDLYGRVVLLEDYDIDDARMMVQGVDVWLNNPRRPLEASGTSGEKAALNGVLNLSILDGWWAEGYNGQNGWALGDPTKVYSLDADQDADDARSLYETLENLVVPLYYERAADGVPAAWVERCKEAIRTLAPVFSTRRMLKEYCAYYVKAMTAVEPAAA